VRENVCDDAESLSERVTEKTCRCVCVCDVPVGTSFKQLCCALFLCGVLV
jgi:hypothetical protein